MRLKRQLAELEKKVADAEATAAKRREQHTANSSIARTKKDLNELLEFKRKELREMDALRNAGNNAQEANAIKEELDTLKGQVQGLQDHLAQRERVLEDLKEQIENERR